MSFSREFSRAFVPAYQQSFAAAENRAARDEERELKQAQETAKLRNKAKTYVRLYPEFFDNSDVPELMDMISIGKDIPKAISDGDFRRAPSTTSETAATESPVRSEAQEAPMGITEQNERAQVQQSIEGPQTNQQAREATPPVQPKSQGLGGLLSNVFSGQPQDMSQVNANDYAGDGWVPPNVGRELSTRQMQGGSSQPVQPQATTAQPSAPATSPAQQAPVQASPNPSQAPSSLAGAGIQPRQPDRGLGNFEMPAAAAGQGSQGLPQGATPTRPQAMPSGTNEFAQVSPLDTQMQEAFVPTASSAAATQSPAQAPASAPQGAPSASQPTATASSAPQGASSGVSWTPVGRSGRFQVRTGQAEKPPGSLNAGLMQAIYNMPEFASGTPEERAALIQRFQNTPDQVALESFVSRISGETDLVSLRAERDWHLSQGREDQAQLIEGILTAREREAQNEASSRVWAKRPGSSEFEWLPKRGDTILDPETNEPLPNAIEASESETQSMTNMVSEGRKAFDTLATVAENRDRFVTNVAEVVDIVDRTDGAVLLQTTAMFSGLQTLGREGRNLANMLGQFRPDALLEETAKNMNIDLADISTLEGDRRREFLDRYYNEAASLDSFITRSLDELDLTRSSNPSRQELGVLLEDYRQFQAALTMLTFEAGRVEGLEGRALSNLNYTEIKNTFTSQTGPDGFKRAIYRYAGSIDRRARSEMRTAVNSPSIDAFRQQHPDAASRLQIDSMPNMRLARKAAQERNIGLVIPVVEMEYVNGRLGEVTAEQAGMIGQELRSLPEDMSSAEKHDLRVQRVIDLQRGINRNDFGLDSMVRIGDQIFVIGPNPEGSPGMMRLYHASGDPRNPLVIPRSR